MRKIKFAIFDIMYFVSATYFAWLPAALLLSYIYMGNNYILDGILILVGPVTTLLLSPIITWANKQKLPQILDGAKGWSNKIIMAYGAIYPTSLIGPVILLGVQMAVTIYLTLKLELPGFILGLTFIAASRLFMTRNPSNVTLSILTPYRMYMVVEEGDGIFGPVRFLINILTTKRFIPYKKARVAGIKFGCCTLFDIENETIDTGVVLSSAHKSIRAMYSSIAELLLKHEDLTPETINVLEGFLEMLLDDHNRMGDMSDPEVAWNWKRLFDNVVAGLPDDVSDLLTDLYEGKLDKEKSMV